jgi:hypothetical protein
MTAPQVYEGTAEEIADQLRCSNLTGRFKAIITPDEYEMSMPEATEQLDTALAELLKEADRIAPGLPAPHTDPTEIAFGEIVTEKYKKMGFRL